MSSPIKRDMQSTKLKNSSSSRAHNLTFYKRDIQEFRPDDHHLHNAVQHERRALQASLIVSQQALRQKSIEQLQKKVEIVLRHNSHLLAENASMAQLLAEKTTELEVIHEKLELQMRGESTNMLWIEVEKKRLLEDFDRRQIEHNEQIRKLLDEISKLHEQCYEVENLKNLEIQKLKESFEKEAFSQIQNLKRSQNGSIELLEAQVRALKQTLEQKNFQMESEHHQSKLNGDKQAEEIKHLQAEIKHLNKIRVLELDECKAHYENEVHQKIREAERKQEIESGATDALLRKLKKELVDKTIDLERLSNRLGAVSQENEAEVQILKNEKEQLRVEIQNLEGVQKQTLRNEREKLRKLTDLQIQNLQNANTNYTNSLKSEIEKLYELSECKTGEIKSLFDQLKAIREASKREADYLNKTNEELKAQLYALQLKNLEELQLLKIKMAELHQGDISSLKNYYEDQLRIAAENALALEKQLAESRAKIHKELQEGNERRKEFEIELSKEKAKNADLKVKLAALSVEMKEQLTSMTSKMELTSQTLLREADMKQKGQAFHDEEKRKLHQLINAKDKEIAQLRDTIERFKKEKEDELKVLKDQIAQVRSFNKELEASLAKQRSTFDSQSRKRQAKAKQEIELLKNELSSIKSVQHAQLKQLIEKLQKENIKLQKDLEHALREHRNVITQLGIRNGFVETMQLESSAAIEEERTKVKVLMNRNEMSMRAYYEEKLALKDKELTALKQQLVEKEADIRDLIQKYKDLEKKLAILLESQQRLRDFEQRVMNLGMDNNLVKNLAELFRTRA